ncbi:uncharacterized protein JN550_012876 [Neoarthrinium moseri]|uniref:uncharacterized protein n=1 Tax=Neoarthrinium moseri TaxID=1658444 RepID=UPI001FDD44DC|nr:uncharacterized protein JN550_012876 [Neoarthrinium moseri]KAI1858054.1 hypothetical protein JN550_012876 [Neoarthrinium moseri]
MTEGKKIFAFDGDWCASTALITQSQILVEARTREGFPLQEQLREAERLRRGYSHGTIAWYWANCLVLTINGTSPAFFGPWPRTWMAWHALQFGLIWWTGVTLERRRKTVNMETDI